MKNTNQPLIAIVGPTASGKSALAMEVARRYGGEIICADSRTVYKGMDIGTAKPSTYDQQEIKHHLLDTVTPDEPFSASTFKQLALRAIADIRSRGKLPLIVGGTGLYVDSVIFDYKFGPPSNIERRNELMSYDIEELWSICRINNIEIPINNKNKRHVIRAIEMGGLIASERQLIPNTHVVGIATERNELRLKVTDRVRLMFEQGVIEEAKVLAALYGWEIEAMTASIYRIVRDVLEGKITQEQATEQVVRSDMALAKRQLAWFKRNPFIKWGTPRTLLAYIDEVLNVVKR